MLNEEFLTPLGLTKYRLAKDIGVPAQRIGDIVAGKRAITATATVHNLTVVTHNVADFSHFKVRVLNPFKEAKR